MYDLSVIILLRYPLSQPDGCQLSQRESQGRFHASAINYNFTFRFSEKYPLKKFIAFSFICAIINKKAPFGASGVISHVQNQQ